MHITLPLIRPAIVVVVILRMTVALSAFAAIYAATGGGPGTATEIINLYAYRVSFAELSLGYGASAAVVLLVLTMAVAALLFHLRRAAMKRSTLRSAILMATAAVCCRLDSAGAVGGPHLVQGREGGARLPADIVFDATVKNFREVLTGADEHRAEPRPAA